MVNPTWPQAAWEGEDWELRWAPHDESTYRDVLKQIYQEDIVYEIGAGDLRLARAIAAVARWVYAIEFHPSLLESAIISYPEGMPSNLAIACGDARLIEFPTGLTTGVLMMRHCRSFPVYFHKLQKAGCKRLITNARWGLGVEVIFLQAKRRPYEELIIGNYGCSCGVAGFKAGPVELLTLDVTESVVEVEGCPACRGQARN